MKFRNLFHMVEDAQEICGLFDKVETPEQMVSALERLKKQFPGELLDLVQSLRLSTEAVLEDTIEPSGTVGEGGEPEGFDDDLLDQISKEDEVVPQSEKPAEAAPAANSNSSNT
jgi:hypothetical protein